MKSHAKETWDWIEDENVGMTFVKRAWICQLGLLTIQNSDSKKNEVIHRKQALGERYVQPIFCKCLFWADEEAEV